jgi:superfamily II DNA or RNA helicase
MDPISGQSALCPYNYHPIFTELTDDESERYAALTEKIRNARSNEEDIE